MPGLQADHGNRGSAERSRNALIVLMPVYNDWEVLRLLLAKLDAEFSQNRRTVSVIIVNDGSTLLPNLDGVSYDAIDTLEVLHLRRNLGHQRAIAIGLAFIEANFKGSQLVVMDADGEDKAEDVVRLLDRSRDAGEDKLIFALRERRSEGPLFRACYVVYRFAFKTLTGHSIQVGNFSVVPPAILSRLVAISEIWNHYASGIQRARVPCAFVGTDRGQRLSGRSTMNFVSLVGHGMSAISVHAETVGARMLILSLLFALGIVFAMCVVVVVRLFTTLAIPGWATAAFGLLALLLFQTFFIALYFAGTVLHGRNAYTFLPSRDYVHMVETLESFRVR
jgi:glycosyltransferase involved in cell wall biosynthesis